MWELIHKKVYIRKMIWTDRGFLLDHYPDQVRELVIVVRKARKIVDKLNTKNKIILLFQYIHKVLIMSKMIKLSSLKVYLHYKTNPLIKIEDY
jgi:hypothetical protein